MRTATCTSLLALLLALAACKPAATPANTHASTGAPAPTPAPTSAPTCPDADFAAFLARFQSDADVQRASTADPLTMESIDAEAMPEPKRISKQVPLSEVEFPVMFDSAQLQTEGLQETVDEPSSTERMVKHAMPDSGVQVRFSFKAAPCWQLTKVSNDTF